MAIADNIGSDHSINVIEIRDLLRSLHIRQTAGERQNSVQRPVPHNVKLDVLNSDLTVTEQLQQDFPQDSIGALRNLAGAFQFSGEDVDKKKIRALSGGEKSRLAIARMLYNPLNSWCSTNLPITWTLRPRKCWWTP